MLLMILMKKNKIELQNVNQKEFGIEKVIMKKGNKLYFNWKE